MAEKEGRQPDDVQDDWSDEYQRDVEPAVCANGSTPQAGSGLFADWHQHPWSSLLQDDYQNTLDTFAAGYANTTASNSAHTNPESDTQPQSRDSQTSFQPPPQPAPKPQGIQHTHVPPNVFGFGSVSFPPFVSTGQSQPRYGSFYHPTATNASGQSYFDDVVTNSHYMAARKQPTAAIELPRNRKRSGSSLQSRPQTKKVTHATPLVEVPAATEHANVRRFFGDHNHHLAAAPEDLPPLYQEIPSPTRIPLESLLQSAAKQVPPEVLHRFLGEHLSAAYQQHHVEQANMQLALNEACEAFREDCIRRGCPSVSKSNGTRYPCYKCSAHFKTRVGWNAHQQRREPSEFFQCPEPQCKKIMGGQHITEHVATHDLSRSKAECKVTYDPHFVGQCPLAHCRKVFRGQLSHTWKALQAHIFETHIDRDGPGYDGLQSFRADKRSDGPDPGHNGWLGGGHGGPGGGQGSGGSYTTTPGGAANYDFSHPSSFDGGYGGGQYRLRQLGPPSCLEPERGRSLTRQSSRERPRVWQSLARLPPVVVEASIRVDLLGVGVGTQQASTEERAVVVLDEMSNADETPNVDEMQNLGETLDVDDTLPVIEKPDSDERRSFAETPKKDDDHCEDSDSDSMAESRDPLASPPIEATSTAATSLSSSLVISPPPGLKSQASASSQSGSISARTQDAQYQRLWNFGITSMPSRTRNSKSVHAGVRMMPLPSTGMTPTLEGQLRRALSSLNLGEATTILGGVPSANERMTLKRTISVSSVSFSGNSTTDQSSRVLPVFELAHAVVLLSRLQVVRGSRSLTEATGGPATVKFGVALTVDQAGLEDALMDADVPEKDGTTAISGPTNEARNSQP